jgi:hypothetical protein
MAQVNFFVCFVTLTIFRPFSLVQRNNLIMPCSLVQQVNPMYAVLNENLSGKQMRVCMRGELIMIMDLVFWYILAEQRIVRSFLFNSKAFYCGTYSNLHQTVFLGVSSFRICF